MRIDGIYRRTKLKTVGFSFGRKGERWVFAEAKDKDLVEFLDILQSKHIKAVTRRRNG